MPKGNNQAKGQPLKPHKQKSIKLSKELCPIVESSEPGITGTIELSLEILRFLSQESSKGNTVAIGLLAKFGLKADLEEEEPIVVYRSDGEVSAWIV